MNLMKPYDDALQEILDHGVERTNKRTGIKTLSIFGMLKRYRLNTEFFPILTRRKVWPKSVFAELLWFLSGSTSNKDLKALGCNFWSPWLSKEFEEKHGFAEGQFGPVYGFQLRYFGGEYGNGAGGHTNLSNSLDGYYANQYIHGEYFGVCKGDTTESVVDLQKRALSGTVMSDVYDSNGVQIADVLFDNDNTKITNADGSLKIISARHENSVLYLTWNKAPSEHYLLSSYEYDTNEYDTKVYGRGGFDQLAWVINRIKEDSSCRRTMWSLWSPQETDKMRLPPCHWSFLVMVDDERRLTGMLHMRSADFPVGVCANIQFYSALTIMIAQQTDCIPHELVVVSGDSHIYFDQIPAVKEYLQLPETQSPKLKINKAADIFSYKPEDFVLSDFNPGPKLEIPVAV